MRRMKPAWSNEVRDFQDKKTEEDPKPPIEYAVADHNSFGVSMDCNPMTFTPRS